MSDKNADHTLAELQEARKEIDMLRHYVDELEALVAWTRATMQKNYDELIEKKFTRASHE